MLAHVRHVASAAAGGQELDARPLKLLDDRDACPALRSGDGGQEPRRPGSDYDDWQFRITDGRFLRSYTMD